MGLKIPKIIATTQEFEILNFQKFRFDLGEWIDIILTQFSLHSKPYDNLKLLEPITNNKRQAQVIMEKSNKRARLINLEVKDMNDGEVSSIISDLQVIGVRDGIVNRDESVVRFQLSDNTSLMMSRRYSWKKQARQRGQ